MENVLTRWISISAIIISIGSFGISAYDAYLSHSEAVLRVEEEHLSVKPYLSFYYPDETDKEILGLNIENSGLGPILFT